MERSEGGSVHRWGERIVRYAVLAYGIAFVYWNADSESVPLVFWPSVQAGSVPVVLVVAGSFLAGFVVAALLTAFSVVRRAGELRRSRRRITELEQELARMRNLPIDDDLHAPPASEALDAEQA